MNYIHELCADSGCSLEDLPGVMDDRNGLGERKPGKSVLLARLDDDDDDDDIRHVHNTHTHTHTHTYIYIYK